MRPSALVESASACTGLINRLMDGNVNPQQASGSMAIFEKRRRWFRLCSLATIRTPRWHWQTRTKSTKSVSVAPRARPAQATTTGLDEDDAQASQEAALKKVRPDPLPAPGDATRGRRRTRPASSATRSRSRRFAWRVRCGAWPAGWLRVHGWRVDREKHEALGFQVPTQPCPSLACCYAMLGSALQLLHLLVAVAVVCIVWGGM